MSDMKVCPCVDCGEDVEVHKCTAKNKVRCATHKVAHRVATSRRYQELRKAAGQPPRTVYHYVCSHCSDKFNTFRKGQIFCSRKCTSEDRSKRWKQAPKVDKPCVDCGTPVPSSPSAANSKIRCPLHRTKFLELMKDRRNASSRTQKQVEAGVYPYEDWVVKGPHWSSSRATWGWRVTLLHKRSPNKKEMSHAEYVLSVKEGRKIDSDEEIVFIDGDIDNCSPDNLRLAQEQKEVA